MKNFVSPASAEAFVKMALYKGVPQLRRDVSETSAKMSSLGVSDIYFVNVFGASWGL